MGGAGILPMAVHDGDIYLLFSRERMLNSSDPDRDFGAILEEADEVWKINTKMQFEKALKNLMEL